MKIFIYGTLKRGQRRSSVLQGQQFLGEVVTKPTHRLYDLGDYPGLVVDQDGRAIEGELWQIDDECLAELDRIEDVPRLYVRGVVELEGDAYDGVQTYFYQGRIKETQEIVEWGKDL